MFEEILEDLLQAPGCQAAAFMDPQGQTIARAGEDDALETLGAYQSVWMAELARVASRTELRGLHEVEYDFESRRCLLRTVGGGYFVLVVLSRDGVPSLVRGKLERAGTLLAAEVG